MGIDELETNFASLIAEVRKMPPGSRRFPASFKKAVVGAMSDGVSATEIASAFNLSYNTIMNWKGRPHAVSSAGKGCKSSDFAPLRVAEDKARPLREYPLKIECRCGVVITVS